MYFFDSVAGQLVVIGGLVLVLVILGWRVRKSPKYRVKPATPVRPPRVVEHRRPHSSPSRPTPASTSRQQRSSYDWDADRRRRQENGSDAGILVSHFGHPDHPRGESHDTDYHSDHSYDGGGSNSGGDSGGGDGGGGD